MYNHMVRRTESVKFSLLSLLPRNTPAHTCYLLLPCLHLALVEVSCETQLNQIQLEYGFQVEQPLN